MSDDEPVGDILASHDDEPLYDDSPVAIAPRRRTGVVLGSAALALTLVAGAGVYAAGRGSGSGVQPESVLPGSTFAMVKVDLQPGGSQSAAIRDFARRFPAAKIGNVDDLRDEVLKSVVDSAGLDYATDVRPWLGRRAAIAGFPGPDGKPHGVVALQATDVAAAKAALAKAKEKTFVAERGGFLLVAQDQETLDLALAASADETLADHNDFASDVAALDGDQVAVAWMDNRRAVTSFVAEVRAESIVDDPHFADDYVKSMESAAHGRVTLGLRATSTYVELQGISRGDARKPGTGKPTDLRQLPETTVGAVYVRDPHGIADKGMSGFDLPTQAFGGFGFGLWPGLLLGGYGGDVPPPTPSRPCPTLPPGAAPPEGEMYGCDPVFPSPCPPDGDDDFCFPPPSPECLKEMEEWAQGDMNEPPPACFKVGGMATASPKGRALTGGLLTNATIIGQDEEDFGSFLWRLREDLSPGMEEELLATLQGDTTVVLGSLPAVGTDRAPDVAVLADVSDEGSAGKFADRFKAAFSERYAEQPVGVVEDGRLVLASDAAYRSRLAAGGLGESELFKLAMGDVGDDVQLAVFANLERVRDAVPGYPADLRPVSAVGMSIGQHDGNGYLRLRVVSR